MLKIRVKILADIPGYNKGREVTVQTDDHGVPLERFWRRRFKDALIDNCLEIVTANKSNPKSKEEKAK